MKPSAALFTDVHVFPACTVTIVSKAMIQTADSVLAHSSYPLTAVFVSVLNVFFFFFFTINHVLTLVAVLHFLSSKWKHFMQKSQNVPCEILPFVLN